MSCNSLQFSTAHLLLFSLGDSEEENRDDQDGEWQAQQLAEIGVHNDAEFLAEIAQELDWEGARYQSRAPTLDGSLVARWLIVVQPGM